MVMSLPAPLPPSTNSSSSSFSPVRSTAESPSEVFFQCQVEFLELRHFRIDAGRFRWFCRVGFSAEFDVAACILNVFHVDDRAGGAGIRLAQFDFAKQHVVFFVRAFFFSGFGFGGGKFFNVFYLELPVGTVAVPVQLAILLHLFDVVFAYAEYLGSLLSVVIFLSHRVSPLF
jgi:hypothetical protein